MAVHDWSRVEAGIFHHFHHAWIEEISRALNRDILPSEYYALAEQHAGGLGPDVLTLQMRHLDAPEPNSEAAGPVDQGHGVCLAPPPVALTAETDTEYYRTKQNSVVVRHVSGHEIVAVVEVVSPGNKSSHRGIESFVRKAGEFLESQVHFLVLDLHPPGPRDPAGIHGVLWEDITGQDYSIPADRPLTLASYECDVSVRAYVEHVAVGGSLPKMPLFLSPGAHVLIPLEETYQTAFSVVPRIWQSILVG
jgi:hypothetical protein